jgi:uncharacterized protein (DUF488 family)
MEFYTIGVYNSSESLFFNKLIQNGIDTFCDIRQRRGVRGPKYAYVNNTRLQAKLSELGINYGHIIQLAPPPEIRELQKDADRINHQLKHDRQALGPVFKTEYNCRILDNFDFELFIEQLENNGAKKVVLFCVEEKPEACHRSLVSDRLSKLKYKVTHL